MGNGVEILGLGLGGDTNAGIRTETGSSKTNGNEGDAPKPMDIITKLQARQKTLTLSPEGKQYCEDLRRQAQESNVRLIFEPFRSGGIDTLIVTEPSRKYAIGLGFAESASKVSDVPAVHHMAVAVDMLKSQGIAPLNTLIIGKEDYTRSNQTFNALCDTFDAFLGISTAAISINDFNNHEIIMSVNPMEVAEYTNRISPHSVPARQDIGALFKILPPGTKPEDATVLGAVTGYVSFVSEIQGGRFSAPSPKFRPVVHIEFHSQILDPAIMALFIVSTVEYYGPGYGWVNQFDRYKADEPNIGNYIIDEKGAPWYAEDPAARDGFIKDYVTQEPPIIVFDCLTGRHQLPLALLMSKKPEMANLLRARLAMFFGVDDNDVNIPSPVIPTLNPIYEYTGVIMTDTMIDSRCVDYPYLINKGISRVDAEPWLDYYADPRIRPNLLSEWFRHNWEPRYQNNIQVVNPAFLNAISIHLSKANIKVTFETRQHQQFGAGLLGDPSVLGLGGQLHLTSSQRIPTGRGGYSLFSL